MIIKRKVGPKGQVVIPKDVRDFLKIHPGDEIILEIENNEVKLKPAVDGGDFLNKFTETRRKVHEPVDIERLLDEEYDHVL